MKTVTLNLIKKNRVYFACRNSSGYDAKLRITPESENLGLGEHDLLVEDVSVRSKWGTDLIYKVIGKVEVEKVITLSHDKYNDRLVDKCRKLGGRWDADNKVWVFSSIVATEVEELDYMYNENIVTVEITAKSDCYGAQGAATFKGYPIARAFDRDSGAKVCDDVSMISGRIDSGGSRKNWATDIEEGSVFRLKMSKNILKESESDKFTFKLIEG